ncbi:MAG: hypothetical protein A2Y53_03840 [Chloroflexi bacterium RBG_16_47_49]|nr:MAG: hypothetical protein A2Y53_03840 [Chloroflexi bacterium RBG_16_47_49]
MNILVTGGKGFIGSHLVTQLKQQRHTVSVFDKVYDDDVREQITLPERIKAADVVFHLAALVNVQESLAQPAEYYRTNVSGTINVLDWCIQYRRKLVYTSTAAVVEPASSPYAHSKAVAEEILRTCRRYLPVVILRLYNVFGPGTNPVAGSVMYRFLTEQQLTVYGSGEQTRDFIHVTDVVNTLTDTLRPDWNGEVVDVGMGFGTSIKDLAGLFQDMTKKSIVWQPKRQEIQHSVANITKLRELYPAALNHDLGDRIYEYVKGNQP